MVVAVTSITVIAIILSVHSLLISGFELDKVSITANEFAANILQSDYTSHRAVFDVNQLSKYDGTDVQLYVNHSTYKYYLKVEAQCNANDQCAGFCTTQCDIPGNDIITSPKPGQTANCGCYSNTCKCEKQGKVIDSVWAFGYTGEKTRGTVNNNYLVAIDYGNVTMPAKMSLSLYDISGEK
jgi:hypothetical protein